MAAVHNGEPRVALLETIVDKESVTVRKDTKRGSEYVKIQRITKIERVFTQQPWCVFNPSGREDITALLRQLVDDTEMLTKNVGEVKA